MWKGNISDTCMCVYPDAHTWNWPLITTDS